MTLSSLLCPCRAPKCTRGAFPGRFCDFVPAAPNLSPKAAKLPEVCPTAPNLLRLLQCPAGRKSRKVSLFGAPGGRYFGSLDYEPNERMMVIFGGTTDVTGPIDKEAEVRDYTGTST